MPTDNLAGLGGKGQGPRAKGLLGMTMLIESKFIPRPSSKRMGNISAKDAVCAPTQFQITLQP